MYAEKTAFSFFSNNLHNSIFLILSPAQQPSFIANELLFVPQPQEAFLTVAAVFPNQRAKTVCVHSTFILSVAVFIHCPLQLSLMLRCLHGNKPITSVNLLFVEEMCE